MKTGKRTLQELLAKQWFAFRTMHSQPPDGPSSMGILPFAAGASVIALFLFACYALTWQSLARFKAAIDTCSSPFCDFSGFYYPMGGSIFQTELPLTGFVYSPFIAILMAVFSPFRLHTALILWGGLQAIAILFYLLLFYKLVPARLPFQLLFVTLALSSFVLMHNLTWGQVGIFTTVSVLWALFFYERGQSVAAAALLAFGISFKFFPVIFFLPFLIRRDVRFLLIGAAACAAFLFVIPGLLLGVDGALGFYSALLEAYRHFDWVISNYNSQHFPHVLLRIAYAGGHNALAYLPLLRGISYGLAALNIGLIYLIQRARLPHANLWSFHILFLSIPFVLSTSWPVDLVYLPFGQALLAWQLFERKRATQPENAIIESQHLSAKAISLARALCTRVHKEKIRISLVQVTALLFLLSSIVLSSIVFFHLNHNRHDYGFYGFTFWADLLLLIATCIVLLPSALRQIRVASGDKLLQGEATGSRTVSINFSKSRMLKEYPKTGARAFTRTPVLGLPFVFL